MFYAFHQNREVCFEQWGHNELIQNGPLTCHKTHNKLSIRRIGAHINPSRTYINKIKLGPTKKTKQQQQL